MPLWLGTRNVKILLLLFNFSGLLYSIIWLHGAFVEHRTGRRQTRIHWAQQGGCGASIQRHNPVNTMYHKGKRAVAGMSLFIHIRQIATGVPPGWWMGASADSKHHSDTRITYDLRSRCTVHLTIHLAANVHRTSYPGTDLLQLPRECKLSTDFWWQQFLSCMAFINTDYAVVVMLSILVGDGVDNRQFIETGVT